MSKTRYKNQKESNEAIAKAYIENDYTNSQNKLLLVSKANYGKISSNVCYSSVDDKGMNFYEFNKNAERNLMLIERYEWSDFSSVTINHSITKSAFTFVGHDKNRDITIEVKGKEVEQVIRNHSSMEVNVVKRPVWTKVLGYRSQTSWKMFMASTIYTLILLFILHALLPAATHNFIMELASLVLFLSIIGLLIGLIKPKWVLPKFKVKTRKRVLFSYLYLIFSCFFIAVAFTDGESTSTPASTQVSSSQNSVTVASKKDGADSSKQKVEKNDSDKAVKEEAKQKAEEQAAKEEAKRKAEEQAAKEEAKRKAEEQAAKEEAKQKAEEQAAKEEAERKAQEQAAKEEAERQAEKQAAKEEAERKAQQQAASQQATTSSSTSSSGNYKPFENDPSDDQQSNMSCSGQIKGNKNSKIYHVPGGAYYDRTQDNIVWFCSEADAQAAGYRKSQR
ncbi:MULTISPECIES: APC family permease [Priestia]|jgi:colicin import membrane protein|nr:MULTISPECIES: APC family permease [Priestia]MCJ7985917.1 APC family permease [Priestia sp. OVL9]MBA9037906.1 flagellar biosynthesis GTPase FlhF [Priestia aryabhattai]MDF2013341.1 APC family permease [Priestia megaterium]MED4090272.1 APC family permease [Priestia megaterium]MED4755816.1 APC family permease [Priestia megaterium]